MSNITNTIHNKFNEKFYTYQVGEFLPIFEGDDLLNKTDFYKYKATKAAERMGQVLVKTAQVSAHVGQVVAHHMANEMVNG